VAQYIVIYLGADFYLAEYVSTPSVVIEFGHVTSFLQLNTILFGQLQTNYTE